MYDSINDCLDEIFSQMEIKKPNAKLENNYLNIIFYLSNIKYPSISFALEEKINTYEDIIKENEKLIKENEELKNRIKKINEKINNLKSTIK